MTYLVFPTPMKFTPNVVFHGLPCGIKSEILMRSIIPLGEPCEITQ